jgi:hypothetical protein
MKNIKAKIMGLRSVDCVETVTIRNGNQAIVSWIMCEPIESSIPGKRFEKRTERRATVTFRSSDESKRFVDLFPRYNLGSTMEARIDAVRQNVEAATRFGTKRWDRHAER